MARYSGTVTFSLGFTAQDVLFMAEFNMNLLSVTKLYFDLDCIVIFNNAKCLIQENRSLKMIGSIDLVEGLYYLSTIQASPQANTSSSKV